MGERRRAHVRRLRVERAVEQLGDVVAHRRQPLEPSVGQHVEAHLQLEVRDHRREVRVAGPLAEAVHASLHLARPSPHRGHGVGDGAAGVVVAVDGDDDVVTEVRLHGADDRFHLVRERPTVRVAQHEVAGALDGRRFERPHRELGVVLVTVEEVLGVDHHPPALAGEELDGVGDHRLTLVERRVECVQHVVVPALGHDAHGLGVRLDEVAQRGVVVDLALRPPGRTERDERRRGELQLRAGTMEELDVLRVRPRPAALDVGDAEHVELLGDPQLVLHRRRDALHLEAVAKRGVEDLDPLVRHRGDPFGEMKKPP